jgi:hypothetical protein
MKATNNKFKATLILAFMFSIIMGAHGYSSEKPGSSAAEVQLSTGGTLEQEVNNGELSASKPVKAVKTINPVTVKNIWENMVSYDRYGNEITARARFNMKQNSMINKIEKNEKDNSGKDNIK